MQCSLPWFEVRLDTAMLFGFFVAREDASAGATIFFFLLRLPIGSLSIGSTLSLGFGGRTVYLGGSGSCLICWFMMSIFITFLASQKYR